MVVLVNRGTCPKLGWLCLVVFACVATAVAVSTPVLAQQQARPLPDGFSISPRDQPESRGLPNDGQPRDPNLRNYQAPMPNFGQGESDGAPGCPYREKDLELVV